ncbi:hypothetical protein BKI52_34295 [marine bacterium AO1-C]|nr:hypothetical protein BKI52_34295 [marine bacterium AO1-C]
MQTIYKGDFCEYVFQVEHSLLIGRWFNTDHMTQDVFKEELIKGELFAIKECQPRIYLVDTSGFELPITPETQKWMAENITVFYARYGVKKLAFLRSQIFVAQLSIQQSNDETAHRAVEKKHFSDEAEALSWLKA